MGLETASFISGLTASWPLPGDTKSQGDDHIRLLKSVLQLTFPNASKAFYIPSAEAFSSTIVLDATDQNNLVMVDTTAGDIACTLPTLGAGDKGWTTEIIRTGGGATTNAVVVSPATGTIGSFVGNTATIRIERILEPTRFTWTGTTWYCFKPGLPIGSGISWDSTSVPAGFRVADGTAYSTTTFAEYNALRGTATLPDKRGRVEAGVDNGAVNRLTATYFGVASALGAVGGLESHTLITAELAVHSHANTLNDPGHAHTNNANAGSTTTGGGGFGAGSNGAATINPNTTGISITNAAAGSGNAHKNVQPTIITNKLIRMC